MLDALSWEIMNATADDWESLEQIHSQVHRHLGTVTAEAIAEAVVRLFASGRFEARQADSIDLVESVDPQTLLREPMEFWFRMTPQGRTIWESHHKTINSAYGVLKDLGPAPSAAEIDEARREGWARFPHADV